MDVIPSRDLRRIYFLAPSSISIFWLAIGSRAGPMPWPDIRICLGWASTSQQHFSCGRQMKVLGRSSVTLVLAAAGDFAEKTVTLKAGETADLAAWQQKVRKRRE